MSKTKIVCPQCGAELAIPKTPHVAVGLVIGSDSNLGTIYPGIVGEHHPSHRPDLSPNCAKTSTPKSMKAEAKIEALRKAGVNVENLFSMKGADGMETIARLENGALTIVPDTDPIFVAIRNSGTIPNSQLFRRWVMAQVFHMLATGNFTKALQKKGYSYQWKMVMDELEAQAKMWAHGDAENFNQRNVFFNKYRITGMAQDYIGRLKEHLDTLPRKLCKKVPYIRLKGENIFVDDICKKVIAPFNSALCRIVSSKDPAQLYEHTVAFFKLIKKTWLVYETPMSAMFKDSYKGAGAYFTMRNMILFHGAKFRNEKGRFLSQKQSLANLEEKTNEYRQEGWRLFGVMKQLIADSGIDIAKKIEEWRKKNKEWRK